jgi:type II secretory pathway pseudopilin PulG
MQVGSSRQHGFTYVTALFAIAILGIGLAAVGQATGAAAQRDQEARLIQTGASVVRAIRSYYYASPGAVRSLPKSWDDLVLDQRFVGTRRHLRQIPIDPFSFKADWGEVRDPDGSLVGIYSLSSKTPFRTQPITFDQPQVRNGETYRDWIFRFVPDPEKP